jgi:mannose-6-phosphate isomerase-like protein (cupin superfamily)
VGSFETIMALPPHAGGGAGPGTHVPRVVEKPWGREVWYAVEAEYAGKVLAVRAGERLSLQYHERKKETLLVLEGQVDVRLGTDTLRLGPGSAFTVSPGTVHRMSAAEDCVLLEVSTPDLDDVVRVECDYGLDR